MILGVDLGNFSVKTSEKVCFLSKISEIDNFTGDNKIIFNGKTLFVGEGEFNTDWNKSRKDITIPLLFSAIYKSSNDNINKIVVGLPINQYKSHKAELKELIENNKCATINNRQLIIDEIEIAPEGAASYYNLSQLNIQKIGNNQLIIVDIGGLTTDITLFINNKIANVLTVPVGMLKIYQDVITYINTNYTQNLVLEDAEFIIKDGLILRGKKIDVSFISSILKRHFDSLYKELQLKFNVDKGYVYLTGGGSLLLQYAFKNRLNNVIVSDDCLFDNSIGFKRVGESLWQEN